MVSLLLYTAGYERPCSGAKLSATVKDNAGIGLLGNSTRKYLNHHYIVSLCLWNTRCSSIELHELATGKEKFYGGSIHDSRWQCLQLFSAT
jgi:hypothetical protein